MGKLGSGRGKLGADHLGLQFLVLQRQVAKFDAARSVWGLGIRETLLPTFLAVVLAVREHRSRAGSKRRGRPSVARGVFPLAFGLMRKTQSRKTAFSPLSLAKPSTPKLKVPLNQYATAGLSSSAVYFIQWRSLGFSSRGLVASDARFSSGDCRGDSEGGVLGDIPWSPHEDCRLAVAWTLNVLRGGVMDVVVFADLARPLPTL